MKNLSLNRIIAVFVAGLFLIVLTACSTPKVLAKEDSTANKPADVMQPSDLQQRQETTGLNEKVQTLVEGSKKNLERHGNYQGSNNPFIPETSVSEGAAGLKNKLGEGVEDLKQNLQNSAEDAKAAARGAARTAKITGDDVSSKAQRAGRDAKNTADDVSNQARRTGYDLRSRTFNND